MKNKRILQQEVGLVTGQLVVNIVLSILVLVLGSVMIWALVNYNDQKTNVNSKIDSAVADAKQQQLNQDNKTFAEREKEPNKQFVGPDDLGRVSFDYPKTWSVYIYNPGTSGTYAAYLNKDQVPSTNGNNKFGLRVSILNQTYSQVLQQYQGLLQSGALRSSVAQASGYNGTRLDGHFTPNVNGAAVIFKVRDKTLILQTDLQTYVHDFNNIVKSLNFNP